MTIKIQQKYKKVLFKILTKIIFKITEITIYVFFKENYNFYEKVFFKTCWLFLISRKRIFAKSFFSQKTYFQISSLNSCLFDFWRRKQLSIQDCRFLRFFWCLGVLAWDKNLLSGAVLKCARGGWRSTTLKLPEAFSFQR